MGLIDKNIKHPDLQRFSRDFYNIETQYLNLIYDPNFDRVVERWVYEKTSGLMSWKCAICGSDILVDRDRSDVENFVCEECKDRYNNKNEIIDVRILSSRTRMFKFIEDKLYEELECSLNRGKR